MADDFESYHVPQQSRRDKLRIMSQNDTACVESTAVSLSALPLYDPSFVSFLGSSSTSHHHYLDPQSFLHMNPSSIQDMNNNPFLYTPQNLENTRDFHQSYDHNSSSAINATGQALSLSLSSHNTHQNLQRYEVTASGYHVVPSNIIDASASTSNDVSRGSISIPVGPFTGYALILKGSRFLKPAQSLLDEVCDVGMGVFAEKISPDGSLMEASLQNLSSVDDSLMSDGRRTKSRLITMLDEVYRSYKQYYQQIQAVVASFESVAGLSNAAPYANLAMKAMSKHFKCLKNAISDQLRLVNKPHGQTSPRKDEGPMFGRTETSLYNRAVHNYGFHDHQPVWRPQRGLPERAVTVLRAWLFEHFLHPYPTDTDKIMLAKQTGLTRGQVSNWFINARVRIWKPMVEEIHMLEQAQKGPRKDRNSNESSDHLSSVPDNPSTSIQRGSQDTPSKRTRNEQLSDVPLGSEPLNSSYTALSSHQHVDFGVNMAGGSNGVSLTLGLHQNNGISLSEPFPMNAAQRFGLGLNNEGYVIGGFEAQNRHFGRDVIGGQLLHDFVG